MFRRLSEHCGRALDIEHTLASRLGQHSVGAELLEKMRQPMILIDGQRRIAYQNRSATQLLQRGHLVHATEGTLGCRDAASDHHFGLALHSLALAPVDGAVPADRRNVRLRSRDGRFVIGTLLALRPEGTMGTFGHHPLALFTVFEPGAGAEIDPFVLSATFDLTPAEARLAAMIVNGRTPEQCAAALGVKISTVRSQLVSIYGKTGAAGRAELVALILSATPP
jgi:DNA-binding CsgD family transcriptional regulator